MPEMASQWPTLTLRHGHALQRTVTKCTAFIQHYFVTVLNNLQAEPTNSLGVICSQTTEKKTTEVKMADFDGTPRTRPSTYMHK